MSGDNTTAGKPPRTLGVPLGQAGKAGDKSDETRLTVLIDHTGEVNSCLVHEDRQHGSYNIPLGRVKTYDKDEAPYGENILVPIIPALDATAPGDADSHGLLGQRVHQIERGYVYVWLDGYLWREFKAQGGGDLREVNLEHYAGQDERPATGTTEHRITVPYKVQGERREIQIAYSRVQWSWRRIERLGGMAYARDPRVAGRNNRHATIPVTGEPGRPIPKDGFEGKQHGAEVRAQRLDRVDVSGHEREPKFAHVVEPDLTARRAGIARLDQTDHRYMACRLAYKKGVLPVVVINSQMAKAYRAREDHAAAVNEREGLLRPLPRR